MRGLRTIIREVVGKQVRLRRRHLLLVLVLLLLLIMGMVSWCNRWPVAVFPERIGEIPVITDLVSLTSAGRPAIEREIKWIVVHETANQNAGATAEAHNRFLHSPAQENVATSWHYTVDEGVIYHHMPDDEVAWHAGDSLKENGGNQNGIGIEICVNNGGDYVQGVQNAAALVAYLLEAYDLELSDVKQHADFINKDCPHFLREGENWQVFLDQVAKNLAD